MKVFKGIDAISYVFLKDHSKCHIKNILERNEKRDQKKKPSNTPCTDKVLEVVVVVEEGGGGYKKKRNKVDRLENYVGNKIKRIWWSDTRPEGKMKDESTLIPF